MEKRRHVKQRKPYYQHTSIGAKTSLLSGDRVRILLADDSSAIQKVIKLSLKDHPYEISVVSSMEDLKTQLSRKDYQLLICDGEIAGKHTVSQLKQLKETYGDHSLTMLILRGSFDSLDAAAYQKAGFAHVLSKPFTVAEILEGVRALTPSPRSEPADVDTADSQRNKASASSWPAASGGSDPSINGAMGALGDMIEPFPEARTLWQSSSSAGEKLSSPSTLSSDHEAEDAEDGVADETHQPSYEGAITGGATLTSLDLDLIAAEVTSRVKLAMQKEIQLELGRFVKGRVKKELRTLIREELESIANQRARF